MVRLCKDEAFTWTLNQSLLDLLHPHAEKGAELVLITGAPLVIAENVAQKVGIFKHVMASTPERNLVGRAKVSALRHKFGPRPFIYVGNSRKDLWVWRYADGCWMVRPSFILKLIGRFLLMNPRFLP
jgi:phosphoserine phosphatase